MKIVKQEKFNQFNIENLTLARVLVIINALDFIQKKGLLTTQGTQLLNALNSQTHLLKL